MVAYLDCRVCQNIDGAGRFDCPGHDEEPPDCEGCGWPPATCMCRVVPDHDCAIPSVCGLPDPYSEMAGMSGPEHIIRCSNAPAYCNFCGAPETHCTCPERDEEIALQQPPVGDRFF